MKFNRWKLAVVIVNSLVTMGICTFIVSIGASPTEAWLVFMAIALTQLAAMEAGAKAQADAMSA